MNEITDNNLDTLIRETLERRKLLAELDNHIVVELRRRERRKCLRRLARTVAFSFAVPMLLLMFAVCMYFFIEQNGMSTFTFFIMAWPTLALIFVTHWAFKTFSPEEL